MVLIRNINLSKSIEMCCSHWIKVRWVLRENPSRIRIFSGRSDMGICTGSNQNKLYYPDTIWIDIALKGDNHIIKSCLLDRKILFSALLSCKFFNNFLDCFRYIVIILPRNKLSLFLAHKVESKKKRTTYMLSPLKRERVTTITEER